VAALAFSIPGGVILLLAVAWYEKRFSTRRSGAPMSATYINEITALFYGTKRTQLDHEQSMSMMRVDDAEAAPPKMGVDLDSGIVVVRPDD
jgi:hypothetical protein